MGPNNDIRRPAFCHRHDTSKKLDAGRSFNRDRTSPHGNPTAAMSMRIVPEASSVPASSHPLEARLKNWEATQDALRMNTLRTTYGLAEPVRRGVELKIVKDGEWRPLALQQAGGGLPSVHEDILKGREDMISWEDVFTGDGGVQAPGVHDEMEKKLKI